MPPSTPTPYQNTNPYTHKESPLQPAAAAACIQPAIKNSRDRILSVGRMKWEGEPGCGWVTGWRYNKTTEQQTYNAPEITKGGHEGGWHTHFLAQSLPSSHSVYSISTGEFRAPPPLRFMRIEDEEILGREGGPMLALLLLSLIPFSVLVQIRSVCQSVNGVTRHSQAGELASGRFWCRFHDNLCAEWLAVICGTK